MYKKYHFAHVVCKLPAQEAEEYLTYHPDFLRFHTRLVERAKDVGKRFRGIHQEDFRTADFPGLLDNVDVGERSIVEELFRSGRREDEVIWQVINYRMYRQIQAIARGTGTAAGINAWVELFNAFMKCGIAGLGEESSLHIYFFDAPGFVSYFLPHITVAATSEKPGFEPLRAEAEGISLFLKACLRGTSLDDLPFSHFLAWVDLYRSVIEREGEE